MLVPDFAHQFLHNVFRGHQPPDGAVAVHHHGHFHLGLLEGLQHPGNLGGLVDQGCLFDQLLQAAVGVLEIGCQEILGVEDSHNLAVVILEYRQTGKTVAAKQLQGFFAAFRNIHGHHVHPGRHDFPDPDVAEFDGAFDQQAVLLVDAAPVFHFVHHQKQFIFRGEPVGHFFPHGPVEGAFQQPEQEIQRSEQHHQHTEQAGAVHGVFFRCIAGHAFGDDFPENQDHNGGEHRGQGQTGRTEGRRGNRRRQGSGGNVHHVVPDQDGGQGIVKMVQQPEGFPGLFAAAFGLVLQPQLVGPGKSRL